MVKPFVITPENSTVITCGQNASIYFISENLAVKVPKKDLEQTFAKLEREYSIQRKIYSAGYPVPEPHGVFPVRLDHRYYRGHYIYRRRDSPDRETANKGLFMERIHGEDLLFSPKEESLMIEARAIVGEIIKNTGCYPEVYGPQSYNVIWDKKGNRLVLVDFGGWEER